MITLEVMSDYSVTANWTDRHGRHHVWLYRDRAAGFTERHPRVTALGEGWRMAGTIYRNPPLGPDGKALGRGQPGYFETRRLDLSGKTHAKTRAAILKAATPAALAALCAALSKAKREARDKAFRDSEIEHFRAAVAAIRADVCRSFELATLVSPAMATFHKESH